MSYIKKHYPKKYFNKNRKYSFKLIIREIIRFTKCSIPYALFGGTINPKTFNKYVLFFSKNNIFQKVYNIILNRYINKHKKYMKLLSIDTSFILNKNGKNKLNRTKIAKNIKNKLKKRKFKRLSKRI